MAESVEARDIAVGDERAAVFALDADWRFTFLNEEAEHLFQEREGVLRGDRAWSWIGDEVHDIYRQTFEAALEDREPVSAEVHCPRLQRWFHVQAYPQRKGVSVHLREMDGRVERERELKRREKALRQAHDVTADRKASPREKIQRLLSVVRGTLRTEAGLVSRHDEETDTFELLYVDADDDVRVSEGAQPSPSETRTCSEVIRTKQTLVIHDVEHQAPDLLGDAEIGTYIGSPIYVDGGVFGTFSFFSTERRSEGFNEWEVTYVDLFSDRVGTELERSAVEPG